ncbi:metallophosphoesterase family protein [Streptomyces sp. NPDC014773]|uniref:metallophosphoesterase family protein n=1 Tax=Streptomyces sp. NPDC014773 TaxID=3364908 RepID=UPI0036F7EDDC
MSGRTSGAAGLRAISDLHVTHEENRRVVRDLRPEHPDDWLLVAGDVGERFTDIEWALRLLRDRFAEVIWAPGNHELWTIPDDPCRARGEAKYLALVEMCRALGVHTPEDPWPVWHGEGGPLAVAPLFVLYDYSFRRPAGLSREAAMKRAHEAGVVCTDEFLLHPDPHPTREDWCAARVAVTEARLEAADPGLPLVLVNHFPLVPDPTDILRHPEFAQWCGTRRTVDWHRRHRVAAVVYGHLHVPRTTWYDGVPFQEVSLGYPREWRRRPGGPAAPHTVRFAADVRGARA